MGNLSPAKDREFTIHNLKKEVEEFVHERDWDKFHSPRNLSISMTMLDDCTRYRVVGLYYERTASSTLLFLEKLIEEMPFPIQRIQPIEAVNSLLRQCRNDS
ncbi:hypothetical protein MYX76_13645 [Desulfobacterota bacterium AH_259_B03_O07]|nr:hypothetical protein [Desulfobacterota bacterium AH_259_B03_O07]